MPEEGDDEASRRKKKKSKKGHARPRDPTLLTREPEVAPEIANEPTEEAVSGGKPIEEGEEWSMRKRRRTTIKAEEGLNEDAVPGAELQLQAEARAAMEKEVFVLRFGEDSAVASTSAICETHLATCSALGAINAFGSGEAFSASHSSMRRRKQRGAG